MSFFIRSYRIIRGPILSYNIYTITSSTTSYHLFPDTKRREHPPPTAFHGPVRVYVIDLPPGRIRGRERVSGIALIR